jgi:MoaA/NifB/PqqE/SkfB family radical SAM enzyme
MGQEEFGVAGHLAAFHPLKSRIAELWQNVVSQAASRIPLVFFKRMPRVVIIDVTNSCNLRCPVCPVTFAMTRPRGLMPLERFRSLIDDLDRHGLQPEIFFNFSGEPTLNRALPDMIAYATAHGHRTFVSTNATKLDTETAEALIRAGLTRISLCLDGFDKEAQESYRIRSDFETVKANIEAFLATRRRLGAQNPVTVLQTLLTSYSENQIGEIKSWAHAVGFDKVRFKTFSLGSHTNRETRSAYSRFLPRRIELRRHMTSRKRATCGAPLHQTIVFWTGQLGLCCIDYNQMVKLPSIDQEGFVSAYRSAAAAKARREGFAKRFAMCQSCSYSAADNMGFVVDFRPVATR